MKLKSKRILSGLLATLTLGQNLLCNNATIITSLTTKASEIKTSAVNKEDLVNGIIDRANELRYSNSGGSEISLFSLFGGNKNNTIDSLNISGYVGLEDNRTVEISVIIFDDNWNTIAETTVYPNEYFSISADNIKNSTSTTHVKIECDGYLPRFYKDMGFGSYQLGTADKPEVLYFGDTTYNPDAENQWSDEVINSNDLDFVGNQVGKRKGDEDFDDRYDLNHDGFINNDDIAIIAEYDGYNYDENTGNLYTNEDKNEWFNIGTVPEYIESILGYDLNGDNVIDSNDQQIICDLYPYGAVKGDEDFKQLSYMDINNNNVIDNEDYEYFSNYIAIHDGYNPYNDYIYNLTLTGNSSHDSAMYLENTNLDLAEYSLVINGNFVFRTQNPYNSMWDNNPGVTLNIGNGGLAISGQFDFGQANSYDKIIMTEDAGQLYIWDNWNYITLADMEGLWTAGEIAFFGSTWQVNETSGKKSVYSTGTHKILFGGCENNQQVIRWNNTCETIYNPDTGERNTERTFNFDYKQGDLCLGVLLKEEYTPENYYFRPEIPDYIAYYQDADNNGINDSIDKILKDGEVSKEEYTENKELIDEFVISNFGNTSEEKEAIARLISPDNPYEEENTKSLLEYAYDGICYIKDKGEEFVVKTFEYGKEVVTTLAEEIPDAVEVIYDGARLIISLSPDPICQSIDFVLSVWDVVDDIGKFECTTEWWTDFGIDVLGVIPYVGVAKEFIKTGKAADKAIDIAKYSKVDGLTGWINQKGLIKTAEKVAKGSSDSVPKVFNSVIDNVIDDADGILKNTDLNNKIDKLTKVVKETATSVKPGTKVNLDKINLDRNVSVIDIFVDDAKRTDKKVSEIIEKSLKAEKIDEAKFVVDKYSRLKNVFSKVSDISQIIEFVDEYGEKAEKSLQKYAEYDDDSQLRYAIEIIIKFKLDGIAALTRTTGEIQNSLDEINEYRNKNNWQPYSKDSKDTVAFSDFNNERIWGVNSGHYSEEEDRMARDYHSKYNKTHYPEHFLSEKYNFGTSQVFTHAEGQVIMKIHKKCIENKISLPNTLNIYVDRGTCGNCKNYQIELTKALGINNLIMINSNGNQLLYYGNDSYSHYFIIDSSGKIKKCTFSTGKQGFIREYNNNLENVMS